MKLVIANPRGDFWFSRELMLRDFPCEQISTIVDLTLLEKEISSLKSGDVYVAVLNEVIPCGIHDFDEAIEYVKRLDQKLLPEGTHAYLIDLAMLHTGCGVLEAVRRSNGRIHLQAGPMTVEELIPQLEAWMRDTREAITDDSD